MSTEPKPVDRIHPNIGRTMTRHDDMPGAIVSQAGEHYIIRWQDGRETPVKVETLAAADRAHLADMGRRVPVKQPVKAAAAPARASPTADMIHKIVFANASGMKDLKTRAREALAEMDLIRAGVKPAPLTATETARILETCRNADPVPHCPTPPDAASTAPVSAYPHRKANATGLNRTATGRLRSGSPWAKSGVASARCSSVGGRQGSRRTSRW